MRRVIFTRASVRKYALNEAEPTLNRATILLSIVTIISLDLILLLGAGVRDTESLQPFFNGLIMVLDLSLVSSSGLLGFHFARQPNKLLAALFFLNVGIFVVAFIVRAIGISFPLLLLFAADLYWLNLYVICLARHWRTLSS
jgi:hypothetical protein